MASYSTVHHTAISHNLHDSVAGTFLNASQRCVEFPIIGYVSDRSAEGLAPASLAGAVRCSPDLNYNENIL